MHSLCSSLFSFSFLSAALALPSQSAETWTIGQQVKTTSGLISGQASSWQKETSEYLGIPYAQPPIKSLRFAPPLPYTSDKTFKAVKFSPSCPGNVHANGSIPYDTVANTMKGILGQAGDVFNEDCLTLNVWTKPQTGEKGKAVMVWIYGGGFNSGNSDSPAYNGARLAQDEDVVVVSINYRVHAFGFPGAGFLKDKNPGLLDQRMGLEWVRDNIAAFGGDPKRITLFGQSAGGISVDLHTYAWVNDPIAIAYIPSSGSMTANSVSSSNGTGWWNMSKKLGCGGPEIGEKSLECIRSKTVDEILAATKGGPRVGAFGPSADGKVVFNDYTKRRTDGNFVKKPMLVGNTNNEGALYEMLGQANVFGTSNGPGINCLTHATAKARRDAGVHAWRYIYSGEWPNQDIGKTGAWHGADIGIWFGTSEYLSHKADTEEEKKLTTQIMKAWTSFAKDPENGLLKLGWPMYDPSKDTVIRIAGKNSAEIAFEAREKHDKYGPAGAQKMC